MNLIKAELGEELGEELGISNGPPPVVADISGLSLEDQQEIEQVNQEVSDFAKNNFVKSQQ